MHGASSHEVSRGPLCSRAGTVNRHGSECQKNGAAIIPNRTQEERRSSGLPNELSSSPLSLSPPSDLPFVRD
jgi:hypothetical protein